MILALAVAVAATIPLGSVGFLETRLVAALAWLVGVLGLLWPRPRNETPPEKSGAARTIALLLGLWCVKDGWFPAESVVAKHPPATDASFYLFNKSLAVISFVASAVCAYIHVVVK